MRSTDLVNNADNCLKVFAEALTGCEILREQRRAHCTGPGVNFVDKLQTSGAVDETGNNDRLVNSLAVSLSQTGAVFVAEGQKVDAVDTLGKKTSGILDVLVECAFQHGRTAGDLAAER